VGYLEGMRALLFVVGLLFVGLAQLLLSEPFMFSPDVGELGWPVGLATTALSVPLLWWASRPDGGRLWNPQLLWGLAVSSWLAAGWIALTAALDPWTLYTIPQWLDPSTLENRPSPGTWRPLHVLHAAGPVFLLLALCATQRPTRWRWLALGGAPWLAGSGIYMILAALGGPAFLG